MWSMGNGENIRIKEDKWISRGVIGGPANRGEPQRVAELINLDNSTWKILALNELFDEELKNEILAIPLNTHEQEDKLV